MLIVATELRHSPIHGVGVYLLAPVKKGKLIWRYDPRVDQVYTEADINVLPQLTQDYIRSRSCWDEKTQRWMLPGDNFRAVNHEQPASMTNSGGAFGDDFAATDLAAGTELTADYFAICDKSRLTGKLDTSRA